MVGPIPSVCRANWSDHRWGYIITHRSQIQKFFTSSHVPRQNSDGCLNSGIFLSRATDEQRRVSDGAFIWLLIFLAIGCLLGYDRIVGGAHGCKRRAVTVGKSYVALLKSELLRFSLP